MSTPVTTAGGGNNNDSDEATSRSPKKKQRVGSSSCFYTISATGSPSLSLLQSPSSCGGVFNDSTTADVVLRLHFDDVDPSSVSSDASFDSTSPAATFDQREILIYLHSVVLRRSKYFAALLLERWQKLDGLDLNNPEIFPKNYRFNLTIPSSADSIDNHLRVLRLLYSDDLLSSIDSVTCALNILPIALELLFEDCISACVKFLEAVPWNEDEEQRILNLIPFLSNDESKDLLARISPAKSDSSEEMLNGLILNAIHNHPNMAFAKAFVAKLLREFSSKESARRVLDKQFEKSLRVVKQSLEEYSSPDFRGNHNETEAIQRLNLHTAMTNGKHLLWLVERMIELKVADTAVKAWSEQASFTADLQRALRDDAWKNIAPSLPAVVLRCTSRLANAVVTGNILAARQVRMKLVRDWLPVLIICKDSVSPMGPNHKSLYLELEETFLRIICTLPMSDAQNLLQQCLSLSTRNVEDCPHLVAAFTTWFRRANRLQQSDFN